jgi:hypothetical protein
MRCKVRSLSSEQESSSVKLSSGSAASAGFLFALLFDPQDEGDISGSFTHQKTTVRTSHQLYFH